MEQSPNEKAPNQRLIGAYQDWIKPILAEREEARNRYESMTFCKNAMIYAMIGEPLSLDHPHVASVSLNLSMLNVVRDALHIPPCPVAVPCCIGVFCC